MSHQAHTYLFDLERHCEAPVPASLAVAIYFQLEYLGEIMLIEV